MNWEFERLYGPCEIPLTEGPVWDGGKLLFTHIRAGLILKYEPGTGSVDIWRSGTNQINGLAYDTNGALFGCCSGGRSIVKLAADGSAQTDVITSLDGRRLNTPNDLAIARDGTIWFSDPWNPAGNLPDGEVEELGHMSVLSARPHEDGIYQVRRATFDTTKPNGVLLSADERTLYVAESHFERGRVRELRAYPILASGALGDYETLFTWGEDDRGVHRGIDGMCLDEDGNILACAGWAQAGSGPMIYVFSPEGRVLETHRVPAQMPTNLCFGGEDMCTLFVTSMQGHLFKVRTNRRGRLPHA
ncbi:SMP-30/gluconolactonase/LRE family protein [Pigmentiphaga kullae]|uniref:Gluconolactonase n=1 Tax=Pigmentiphaga kullae TaxID=151784 RepID=A0A4Q7NNL7_9BURK|nr:SMP-30/gluconolactonase/LRE family protein [Pigmentiphaga kullae]RZS86672.1 gluconolactonase [Pigmentiphaga kullae]